MSKVSFAAIVMCASILGCRSDQSPPSVRAEAGGAQEGAQSPVSVEWIEHSRVSGVATVSLIVRKMAPLGSSLEVSLRLGSGIVSEPPVAFTMASGEVATVERRIVLRSSTAKPNEAVAIVHSGGRGLGYHAEVPYRFGQAPPAALTPPARSGPSLSVGAHDLGPAIPLQ